MANLAGLVVEWAGTSGRELVVYWTTSITGPRNARDEARVTVTGFVGVAAGGTVTPFPAGAYSPGGTEGW
jgi:hypothetical protein